MNNNERFAHEAFSEEIAINNAELIKHYLETEFLAKSLMGTDVVEIKGQEYQATILSGIIDNETGELVSIGGENFKEIDEFRKTPFSIKLIVDHIYKNREERIDNLTNNQTFTPEVVDSEINVYSDPRVQEILDRTLTNLALIIPRKG